MNEKEIDEYSENLYKEAESLMVEMLLTLRENMPEDKMSTDEIFTLATIMLAVNSVGLYKEKNPAMAMVFKTTAIDMLNVI